MLSRSRAIESCPIKLVGAYRSPTNPRRIPTPSTIPTNKWPSSENPIEMDKFSMITMLLRATVTLRHRNEDLALWAFRPTPSGSPIDPDFEIPLEAFNALLTSNRGVVAGSFRDQEQLIMPHKNSMPCNIVIMANAPKKTNSVETNSNPLNLRFITDGEDLWPTIKQSQADEYDPLGIIARGELVSLGSHAKTVCSYLNDFKAAKATPSNSDKKMGYGRKFFNYLLSFCWEKLYRRFTSWPGLGFVHKLELTWLELKRSDAIKEYPLWESFNKPHTGDRSLVKFLKNCQFIPDILNAILVRGGASQSISFDSLKQAVKEEQQALFAKNTAEDFHALVLGTFITLTAELERFNTHHRNRKEPDSNAREDAMINFRRIGLYTRLLLNILASTSFRTYITFMAQCGVKNLIPVFEDRLSYNLKWRVRRAALTGGTPIKTDTSTSVEDPFEEPEVDFEALRPKEDNFQVLIQWIRCFLLEFFGKRHLERTSIIMHTRYPESSIEIAVITTDRVYYSIPQWSDFKSLINDALQTCLDRPAKYNTNFVVARLSEELGKNRQSYRISIDYISHFRKLIDYEKRGESSKGKWAVPLDIHCQAGLVALSRFPEAFRESKDISLTFRSFMISLSRLCCPVCWELIKLSGNSLLTNATDDSSPRLAVRGSHPDIYPLALPPWISDAVRGEMNSKFLGYLGAELVQLMEVLDAEQAVARPAEAWH